MLVSVAHEQELLAVKFQQADVVAFVGDQAANQRPVAEADQATLATLPAVVVVLHAASLLVGIVPKANHIGRKRLTGLLGKQKQRAKLRRSRDCCVQNPTATILPCNFSRKGVAGLVELLSDLCCRCLAAHRHG